MRWRQLQCSSRFTSLQYKNTISVFVWSDFGLIVVSEKNPENQSIIGAGKDLKNGNFKRLDLRKRQRPIAAGWLINCWLYLYPALTQAHLVFVHLLPQSILPLTLLQPRIALALTLFFSLCHSVLNESNSLFNRSQHFRAAQGPSAKCSISDSCLKEVFLKGKVSQDCFCSPECSKEKWGRSRSASSYILNQCNEARKIIGKI